MTPNELNEYLKKKWGLDLLPFASFLTVVVKRTFISVKKHEYEISFYLRNLKTKTFELTDVALEHFPFTFYNDQVEYRVESGEVKFFDRKNNTEKKIKVNEMIPNKKYYLTDEGKGRIKDKRNKNYDLIAMKGLKKLKLESDLAKYDVAILKGLKEKYVNLKKRIIEIGIESDLYFYNDNTDKKLHKKWPTDKFEKRFVEEWQLESFFDLINWYIFDIDEELENRKPGPSINKRNLLASMWALYLKGSDKNIDWELFAELIDWFWKRFSKYKAYKDLKPQEWEDEKTGEIEEQTFADYLRNQFLKHKKRWENYYKRYMSYIYHQGLMKEVWCDGKLAIIFGRKKNEINFIYPIIAQAYYRKECMVEKPDDTFIPFAEQFYKNDSYFDWVIIFPDYSYLLSK